MQAEGVCTLDHPSCKNYYYDDGVPKPERVQVGGVPVSACWLIGRQRAQTDLVECSVFTSASVDFVALAQAGKADMLRSCGKWVGVKGNEGSDGAAVECSGGAAAESSDGAIHVKCDLGRVLASVALFVLPRNARVDCISCISCIICITSKHSCCLH